MNILIFLSLLMLEITAFASGMSVPRQPHTCLDRIPPSDLGWLLFTALTMHVTEERFQSFS